VSFILDALKKAERERARPRVPTLATIHVVPVERRVLWPWVVGGFLCVNAVLLFVLFHSGHLGVLQAPAVTAPGSSAPTAVAPTTPAASNPSVVGPSPAVQRFRVSWNKRRRPQGLRVPRPFQVLSGPQLRCPPLSTLPSGRRVAPVERRHPRPAPVSEIERRKASFSREEAPRSAAPVVLAVPERPEPSSASATAGARRDPSQMKLEVLVYSDNPAERAAYIGGRRYVEGQRVEGGLRVETIAHDSVTLSGEGQRFVLRRH